VSDFVAIDFETTGLSPSSPFHHRVIEVGVVRFSLEKGILAEYESLVNPLRDVGAFEIHRITAGMTSAAPTFSEIAPDLIDLLNGARLVAHNKTFDLRFLVSELERANIVFDSVEGLCTMHLTGLVKPHSPRRLVDCCEVLGIDLLPSHSALNDAKMAAGIALNVLRSVGYPDLPEPIQIHKPHRRAHLPLRRDEHLPRTVTQGNYLKKLMEGLKHQEVPVKRMGIAVAEYLNLLERTLEDRRIDHEEAQALVELADRLMIPLSQLDAVHATYFSSLCEHALADGEISPREEDDLRSVSELLHLGDWREIVNASAPRLPSSQSSTRIAAGTTVCFTGAMKYPRSSCEAFASRAGLVVLERVTRQLDILVVADPDSQSNKARKAREYGTRIMSESAFFSLVGDSGELDSESENELESITPGSDTADEVGEFSISLSIQIGGQDVGLYEANEAIEDDQRVAEDEVRQLLANLPAQKADVIELGERTKTIRKNLPDHCSLDDVAHKIAPLIREHLTDYYSHLQYLREDSHIVTREIQDLAHWTAERVTSNLATLSLIPSLHRHSSITPEVWSQLLLGDINRTLSALRTDAKKLTTSHFLEAEARTDFEDPRVANRLTGLSIVITGDFGTFSREEGRGAILRRGGKSPSSISSRTYALVAGELPGPSKLQQALNSGVRVLSEQGFRKLLDDGPEPPNPPGDAERETKTQSKEFATIEVLTCRSCGSEFSRERTKGRKPHECPSCAS
jgi:DNA polymerase-3 subunit epsilon